MSAGWRQHGPAASGIRGALLACPDGGTRGCRRGGANMGLRRAGFGAPCWRVPTVDQGFAGGMAPTWAGAGLDSRRPVGVARRWDKGLSAGRRQHGPAPGGIRGALLAWPDGGIRGCRRDGANMGRRRAGFEAPCWRGPAVDQGFAGGMAPTWAGAGWDSGRPVGVVRRWIKALPAGRRQHGPAPGGIRGALLAWSDGGLRLCRRGGANMGRRRAG